MNSSISVQDFHVWNDLIVEAEATVLPVDSFVLFDKEMKLWVCGAFYKLGLREGS